jgi:hypothetical protein
LQEHLRSNYVLRGSRLDTDVLALVGSEIDEAAGLRRGASPGV